MSGVLAKDSFWTLVDGDEVHVRRSSLWDSADAVVLAHPDMFESVSTDGGGSQPFGAPVADGGGTFYGLPAGMNGSATWIGAVINGTLGKIRYAPMLVTQPTTVTAVLVAFETSGAAEAHVTLALVAADAEWQPTGAPLIQEEIDIPAALAITAVNQGAKTFSVAGDWRTWFPVNELATVAGSTGNDGVYSVVGAAFTSGHTVVTVQEAIPDATADGNLAWLQPAVEYEIDLDSPVTLQPGLYLQAMTCDDTDVQSDVGFSSFPGSYICDGLASGRMLAAMRASHAYGPLADPLPKWTEPDASFDALFGNDLGVSVAVLFFLEFTSP